MMDVRSTEEEETGGSTKRLSFCEVNKDFISYLPDPILVRILSFLPLGTKTVLLRGFGKLWLSVPVLDLDNCLAENELSHFHNGCDYENLMSIIHQVWNHDDNTPLEKLHLKFTFEVAYLKNESTLSGHPEDEDYVKAEKEREKAAADQIEKLVGYALSRKVKVLDLNFRGCERLVSLGELYELPDVFRSDCLTDLRLASCDMRSCGNINLPALGVLHLHEVFLSDNVMKEILLGCPLLEDLAVVDCYGLSNLNCENPNLKKVMLSVDLASSNLSLSCPHAVSLEISGC